MNKKEMEFNERQEFLSQNSALIERYVGTNVDSYMKAFNSIKKFNWAAFFFNSTWLFYRKMYSLGMIVIGIQAIFTYSILLTVENGAELWIFPIIIIGLILSIILGKKANVIYFKTIKDRIEKNEKKLGVTVFGMYICGVIGYVVQLLLGLLFN